MGNASDARSEKVEVETYSGYKAGETPRKVIVNGKEFPVEFIVFHDRVLDVETNEQSEHFKLQLKGLGECDVTHNVKWDTWEMEKDDGRTFSEILEEKQN